MTWQRPMKQPTVNKKGQQVLICQPVFSWLPEQNDLRMFMCGAVFMIESNNLLHGIPFFCQSKFRYNFNWYHQGCVLIRACDI